jgi:hypothetical protein
MSCACGGPNATLNVGGCPLLSAPAGTSTTPRTPSDAGKSIVIVSAEPEEWNTPRAGVARDRYDGRDDQACGPPVDQRLAAG